MQNSSNQELETRFEAHLLDVSGALPGKINASWMGEGQFIMLRPLISAELNVLILFLDAKLQGLSGVLMKQFFCSCLLLVIRGSNMKRAIAESV